MKRKCIYKYVRLFSLDYFDRYNSFYVRRLRNFSPFNTDVRHQTIAGVPNPLSYLRGAYGENTWIVVSHKGEWAPRTAPIILDWVVLHYSLMLYSVKVTI